MYHLRLKGDHYEMGVKRGKLFEKNGVFFPLRLDDFQLRHGKASERILRHYFPQVCQEVQGIADTLGVDYLSLISWMLCMGCCMYNLKDNIPSEIRGCTAFAFSDSRQIIYGRNNDLPPFLKKGSKSEIYTPDRGNQFNLTTSSFINGEEGLNQHGLAVAMTFVLTDLKEIKAGFNSCFIVRYLLEKACNAAQALSMLLELPIASNCNILLADKGGNMLVAECTPTAKNIRRPQETDTGYGICTVNSFISEKMKPYDFAKGQDYYSRQRFPVVMETLNRHMKGNLIDTAQKLLKGEYGFMCQYDQEPDFETVWSSVFDLKNLTIYRAEGDPRKKKFIVDKRLQSNK